MKVRNLNNNEVAKFVGGDMEIQNKNEYLYRGRIKSVNINNNVLLVKFAWMAKGKGYPVLPIKWVKEDKFASVGYVRNLEFYRISKIRGQLIFTPLFTSEIVTLFPPKSKNNLDPAEVEGLKRSIERRERIPA